MESEKRREQKRIANKNYYHRHKNNEEFAKRKRLQNRQSYIKNKEKRRLHHNEYNESVKKRMDEDLEFKKNMQKKWREYRKIRKLKNLENFRELGAIRQYAHEMFEEDIFKRDNFKCRLCGIEKDLEMHHKKYTRNKEDIILVCNKCHKKIHRKY